MAAVTIESLPAARRDLAWKIISEADLPAREDAWLRHSLHDFDQGVGWGLARTLAELRGCTAEEASRALAGKF